MDILPFPGVAPAMPRYRQKLTFVFPEEGVEVEVEEWGDAEPPCPSVECSRGSGHRYVGRLINRSTGAVSLHRPSPGEDGAALPAPVPTATRATRP